ncbi:jg27012, partial [Pararge aegeria aegeria]
IPSPTSPVAPKQNGSLSARGDDAPPDNHKPAPLNNNTPDKQPVSRTVTIDKKNSLKARNASVAALVLQMFMGGGDHLTSGDPLARLPAINICCDSN